MNKLQERYPLVLGSDNPTLRTVCNPVGKITAEIKEFGKVLLILMHAYDGVGLAAPQIGEIIRMAAFSQFDFSTRKVKQTMEDVMINPIIVSKSSTNESDEEGCLSLPGVTGYVSRPDTIVVEYTNLEGKKVIHKAIGYNARIIQHEMDHLDGVLFVDKLDK